MVLLLQFHECVHHLVVQLPAVGVEGLGGAASLFLLGQDSLKLGYSLLQLCILGRLLLEGLRLANLVHCTQSKLFNHDALF